MFPPICGSFHNLKFLNPRWPLFLIFSSTLLASPPAWWSDPQTRILNSNPPNNAAPVANAQLKFVAKQAAKYLNQTLPPPGAGAKINALVAGFHPSPKDRNIATIAELKAVTKPFYNRLLEVGFNTKLSLQSHGAPGWAYDYPWNPATPKTKNLAPASICQLKWCYSFNLSGFTIVDANGNNLPDAWETLNGFDLSFSNAEGDGDADELSNSQEYFMGTDPNAWDTDGDDIADGNDPNPLIQNPSVPADFYVAIPDVEENNPDVDYTKIKLRWQASSYNPTGYRIERRIEPGEWQQLASVSAGTTQYADQNLLANQHYQYRITAYREVDGQQIYSESVYADYDVPVLLSFEVKQSSLTRSKDSQGGFAEFTNPSNPPKLYLKKTESWSYSDSYSDSNSSSDNTVSYAYVSTIDPQAKTKTYHGEYSYTHNDFFEVNYPDNGNSDWSHETETSTYDRTEKSRSRSRLQSETNESYTSAYNENGGASAWWFGGGYSSGTHWIDEDVNESYLYQALYTPNGNGPPIWKGSDYDLANGTLSYSGQAAYSKVHTESNPIYNHTESESLTVNPVTGGWVGGWPTFTGWPKYKPLPKPNQTVTNTTQTLKTFANPPGTSELTQEYTTQAFVADTINDLPDYPNAWTKSWVGGSDNLPSVLLPYGPKAWRYLSNNEAYLDVKKFKYRMKASPSIPYTMAWVETFVPDAIYALPAGQSIEIEVVQTRSWNLAPSLNASPEFEVSDAVSRSENGQNYLLYPEITFEPVVHNNDDSNASIEDNKYPSDWGAYGNPLAWKWMPGGGKRIFPDAQTPADNQPRDEVDISVRLGIPNAKLYLRVIDVDDPTPPKYDLDPNTQQHVVDPNDQGGEKGGDNTGTPAKFTASNSDEVDCVTDANGYAKVGNDLPRLKVSMRAGDNYRVAVAFKKSDLGMLQVTNKVSSGYVPASSEGVTGFKGSVSPMLTVWRKINLEIDTMDKIIQPKGAYDHLSFTNAHWVSPNVLSAHMPDGGDPEPNNFYNGGYVQKGNSKARISASTLVPHFGYLEIQFELELHPNINEGDSFEAYDDDDRFLDVLGLNPPLPKANKHAEIVRAINPIYNQAYIEVADADEWNTNKVLPFELSQSPVLPGVFFEYGNLAAKRDLPLSTNTFWSWLVVIVYQGPRGNDFDPQDGTEGFLLGQTNPGNFLVPEKLSVVAYETIRDMAMEGQTGAQFNQQVHRDKAKKDIDNWFYGTIAHELGHNHSTGNDHFENGSNSAENGIMQEGAIPLNYPGAYFKPHTILRFRMNTIW